jgi:hypothetical protein
MRSLVWDSSRALLVTAGRPTLRRALAAWTVVGIAATIVFAGNGLDARDLTRLFHHSAIARLALTATWITPMTSVVSCAFDAPGTRTLRTLPVRRRIWVGGLLALLLIVQLPCGILFARADGLPTALALVLLAVAIEASCVAATRRRRALFTVGVALGLVLVDAPPIVTALPAAALAAAAVADAWGTALEAVDRDVRSTRVTSPVVILTAAHLLRMLRAARARVALATGIVALGGLALALSLHHDPTARPFGRVLAVLAFPIALCAALLADPVRETEDHVRTLARVTRTRWPTLLAAFALALVTPSSALAATAGTLVGGVARMPALSVGGAAGLWAVPIASAVAAWARWHGRRARPNPALFVLGVAGVGAIATAIGLAW